jgi:hypothetical protein
MVKTTTIRGSRRRHAPVLLALAALAACEGKDVWVGEVGGGLNLDVCAGQETDCDPNVDDETLTTPAVRSCDGEIGPELEADFDLKIADATCPDPSLCSQLPLRLAIAPDASAWILGVNHELESGTGELLWLAHYDDGGELLSVSDVAMGVPFNGGTVLHEADFTLDERGHAFVVIYENDGGPNADSPLAERAWVSELSPSGRPARGTGVLTGIGAAQVALATDGKVVLAANALQNARHGVLAKLTAQGERVWSQTNIRTSGQGVGYGVTGLTTDSSDHALVLAERKNNGGALTFGLTRFDRVGNAVWDRAIDRPLGKAVLSADAEGNAVISAEIEPIDLGENNFRARSMVVHVRASGAADWAYAYDGGAAEAAIDPNSGEVMFQGQDEAGPPYVAVISPDGESCRRYALPLDIPSASLAVDGEGRLYFMTQFHFGRVRFPEE